MEDDGSISYQILIYYHILLIINSFKRNIAPG